MSVIYRGFRGLRVAFLYGGATVSSLLLRGKSVLCGCEFGAVCRGPTDLRTTPFSQQRRPRPDVEMNPNDEGQTVDWEDLDKTRL